MPIEMLHMEREASVPFGDAVSYYAYTATVAYADEYGALADS
jgi:hypothetical protein